MRVLTVTRRLIALATLVAAALGPVPAGASASDTTALSSTFADGAGGWTATSACAPLCSVTNAIDSGAGASGPGSAAVIYTTLAGLLGGLATGTSTWTSPSFTWTAAAPDQATFSFARKASITALLSVGGSASSRIQLDDLTAGTLATIASEGITTADSSFVTHTISLDPSLLKQAHSYKLLLTTNLSAAALLSGIRVAYDDVLLSGTSAPSGGTGGTGGTGGGDPGTHPGTDPAGGGNPPGALRLLAPAVVHFKRGHAITVRVRATRAGKAVGHLVVTLRLANSTRRVSTGQDGSASIRLSLRVRGPIRITFRAGTAVATTWARTG
jgi:hypothetical protein